MLADLTKAGGHGRTEVTPELCVRKLVGARLRELRLEAELTQGQISDLTGIHRPIVCRIERGVHAASLETVQRYVMALELDAATVLVCLDDDWIAAGQAARAGAA